jgi:O-antigen ligase
VIPAITRPVIAIGLVAAAAGLWLASKSVAYPLGIAFAPSLVEAIYGSNPLPKGATTYLFFGWIGLAIVIAMIRGEHPRLLFSAPVLVSFALLGLMVARLGASPESAYGSHKLQLFIANNLIFLIAGIFVGTRRRDTERFFVLMLTIAATGALLLMVELATGAASNLIADRFSISAQEYPIQLGRSSSDGLLLAIYGMLAWRSLSGRLWATAAFPALAVTLIAAGSRGPVVAFAIALVTLLAMSATTPRARRRLTLVLVVGVGAIVLVPLVVPSSTIGRALSALFGGASGLSTTGRAGLWKVAADAFAAHPLLGIGTGGFAGLQTTELYPHNILIEAAAELGIVGAILVAWFIIGSLRRLLARRRVLPSADKLEMSIVIALFVAALVNALFSGAIQDNREIWLWAGLGLGICSRPLARAAEPAREIAPIEPPPARHRVHA